jgi:phage tail-like protein
VATDNLDLAARPFTAFRFAFEARIEKLPGAEGATICAGNFSEIDGLEMTVEPRTIREGGRNAGPVHLVGPTGYGQVTLKRGMTENFDLWRWFKYVTSPGHRGVRPDADVVMKSSDGTQVDARFRLERVMPVKMKAPALNAKDGQIAIEEMQLVYERLLVQPETK